MTPSARLAAAIDVLRDMEMQGRSAREALKAWGSGARYAGAKDRAWVSGLVLDVLRRRRSLQWAIGLEGPRAAALSALVNAWGWPVGQAAEAAAGAPHGPGALTDEEARGLAAPRSLADAPPPVAGDYPDWLDAGMERAFGAVRAVEGAALARRAPVDLRANILKTDADHVAEVLEPAGAERSAIVANAFRIAAPVAADRAPAVESLPAFADGWFEVQDLGSQIAAAAAGPIAGRQVLDLCAGGGGKTLALSAAMANTGQIYAYDTDARRLAEASGRAQRAGVRNLQVIQPSSLGLLGELKARMDVVFVDAPCTGSGTWRRRPDAKWRLTPAQLAERIADQDAVLKTSGDLVRTGGRVVYVTCSVLAEENEDRIAAFLAGSPRFAVIPSLEAIAASGLATEAGATHLADHATPEGFLRLSPRSGGTDGFFIAVLERRS